MAKQTRVIISGILATTSMTLFSYLFSAMSDNNTKEPELLGKMLNRLSPGIKKRPSRLAGWVLHYAVGLLFAEIYAQFWDRSVTPDSRSGLIFGGLSGISAILIWKFTLTIHPFAPATDFKSFGINLFLAHLVFGLFAVIGYKWKD